MKYRYEFTDTLGDGDRRSAMQETGIASLPVTAIPAGMKIPFVTAGSA
ncbi:putative outer membrane protein Lom [Escherichia coli DEC5E]|nr:putative outer membrane protein Lom [Escherichia coli DEC5E]